MNNEPKVVRRNPRFGSTLPQSQVVQKYSRYDHKWVALALGVAVLIVVGLDSAWLMGWLPR